MADVYGIPEGTYHASGIGSQHIIIIPEWNTLVLHKSYLNAEAAFKLYAIQKGYTEEYVMYKITKIGEELIDLVYNKCKRPEYSKNEICKKCKPVDDSDFNKLLNMIVNARIEL